MAARLAAKLSFTSIKIIGSERNANYTLKPIQKRAYIFTKHLVNAIVANSQSGAEFNAKQTGQPKSKYHVVYNGVDTNRFKPQSNQNIRAELGIAESAQVIGMFASFKKQKNHPFLIKALQQVKKQGVNFKLLLVGDVLYGGLHGSDNYTVALKQLIQESGFSQDVIYLGNRDDVERLYPACDFTVLPSLFEGTPNVVLESMACGVPCIATDVSDNARIIKHTSSGYIVAVDDIDSLSQYILGLINQPNLLNELSNNAQQTIIEKFSSYKLSENMEAIYSSVSCKNRL
ncbi:glycosyltransferase family 4 protein [Psychromonas sp. MME1]|uniref:glycosyltransferase family 4 protein n=1 Tax=Psychromonas sp. MME1 TaxID=3231032 RepID=UPI0034E207B5